MQSTLKLVVLFGSYTKGDYIAASGVNLLTLYRGGQRGDTKNSCL